MWSKSRPGRGNEGLRGRRRRRARRTRPGGEALEPRRLLSRLDSQDLSIAPHFTDLVQPPRAIGQDVSLPFAPGVKLAGAPGASIPAGAPIPAGASGAPIPVGGLPPGGPPLRPEAGGGGGISAQCSTCLLGLIDTPYSDSGSFWAQGASVYYDYATDATGSSKSAIAITFNPAYGYLDLFLKDSQGQVVRSSIDGSVGQGVSLAGLPPGAYQLQIYAYSVGSYGVSYDLAIVPPAYVQHDAYDGSGGRNDSILTPTVLGTLTDKPVFSNLSLDSHYNYQDSSGNLHYGNDVDWYVFRTTGTAVSGDGIVAQFDPSQAPVDLALFDAYGDFLGLAATVVDNDLTVLDLAGAPAGIYYLAAFDLAAYAGGGYGTNSSYSLGFSLPPAIKQDTYSAPNDKNQVPAGAPDLGQQSGLAQYGTLAAPLSIDTPGVGDWYKFEIGAGATQGDFAAIEFNALAGQLVMGLTDANRTTILGISTAQGNTEAVSLAYLPAGAYYLYVTGAYGATNPAYLLTINAPSAVPLGPDQYDQKGSNNTLAAATVLGTLPGRATYDRLSITPGDVDWYTFTTTGAATGGYYVGLNFNPSQGLIDAAVIDAQGRLVGQADRASYVRSDRGVEARMPLQGAPQGTYAVVVYGLNGAISPDYALDFNLPGGTPPSSIDNSQANAAPLGRLTGIHTYSTLGNLYAPDSLQQDNLNASAPLAILSPSDQNWFQFTLAASPVPGDYVSIRFDNRFGALALDLLDANGKLIAGTATSGGVAQVSLYGNSKIQAGQTYYVRVEGYQGGMTPSYALRINAPGGDRFEPDDTRDKAHVLNDPAVGSMGGGTVHGLETWTDLSIEPAPSGSVPGGAGAPAPDVDWYQFAMVSAGLDGNYARIDYDRSLGDLDLGLYDSSGNLITLASTAQGFEQISLQGLAGGKTYYLKVSGYKGATNPDYTLTLNTPEMLAPDAYEANGGNNTSQNAIQLGTILGQETIGNQDHPLSITTGDQDWYRFTTDAVGGAGHYVSITYNQAAGPLVLELDDASGKPIPSVLPASGFGDTETISLNTLKAGTYTIHVSGYQGATNPDYVLTVSAPGTARGDWAEPNNVPKKGQDPGNPNDQAYSLGTISGIEVWQGLSIDSPADKDWFSFTTTATGGAADSVAIAFDPSLGRLDMALVDSLGNRVDAKAVGGSQVISLAGQPAGTYTIEVYGAPDAINSLYSNPSYTLSVTAPGRTAVDAVVEHQGGRADNHSLAYAFDLGTPAGPGNIGPMSLLAPGETDWFQFTIPQGLTAGADDYVGIVLDNTLGDLDVQLVDKTTGNILVDGNHNKRQSATSQNFERVSLAGLSGGTYYVEVLGYKGATNPQYDLAWQLPDPTTPSNGFGPINSPADAADLHTVDGYQVFGGLSIQSASDPNWFQFDMVSGSTGVQGQNISIVDDDTQGHLTLELYDQSILTDPNAKPIATSNVAGDEQIISLANQKAANGPYYIHVFGKANPSYTLAINAPQSLRPDWAEQHLGLSNGSWTMLPDNNSLANAYDLRTLTTPILLGGLSIDRAGERDEFRFTTSGTGLPGQYVELDTNSYAGGLLVRILDKNGNVVRDRNGNPLQATTVLDSEDLSLDGLPAGTYDIEVYGASASVTNPSYVLAIVPPATPSPDFAAGLNNLPSGAFDLGDASSAVMAIRPINGPYPVTGGSLGGSPFSAAGGAGMPAAPDEFAIFDQGPKAQFGSPLGQLYENLTFGIAGLERYRQAQASLPSVGSIVGNALGESSGSLASALQAVGFDPSQLGLGPAGSSGSSVSFAQPAPVQDPLVTLLQLQQQQEQLQQQQYQLWLFQQQQAIQAQQQAAAQAQYYAQMQQAAALAQQWHANPYSAVPVPGGLGGIGQLLHLPGSSSNYGLPGVPLAFNVPGSGLDHLLTFSNLSLVTAGETDWFKFTLSQDGQAGQFAAVAFDHDESDLQIRLYASNDTAHPIEVGVGAGDVNRLDLQDLAAGSYYIEVTGDRPIANYDLTINAIIAPPPAGPAPTDWAQPNSQSNPRDLRSISGSQSFTGLWINPATSSAPNQDWFAFTTQVTGADDRFVEIDFDNSAGDLDLALYNSNAPSAKPIAVAQGTGSSERIALVGSDGKGLPNGTYYIEVYGYLKDTKGDYVLTINAPQPVQPDALQPNNAFALATNLDDMSHVNNLDDLSITPGGTEYFRFTLAQDATRSDQVAIDFEQTNQPLQVQLYKASDLTHPIGTPSGTGNHLMIPLAGLKAQDGPYYIRVAALNNDPKIANTYSLHVDVAPPSATPAPAENAWTIMVYLTVDNLGPYARQSLIQMQQVAAHLPGNVKIAVLLDKNATDAFATGGNGTWSDTGEAIIQPSTDTKDVTTTFARIGEQDTGDPRTLESFMKWAAGAAPAQHYALILWDHGGGLLGSNEDFESPNGSGGYDAITPAALGQALKAVRGVSIDVLAFDACLMGMAEVATAVGSGASVVVGSEASVSGAGFDYTRALATLSFNPAAVTPDALASGLVRSYEISSAGQVQDDTLSATETGGLAALETALKTFVTAALADSNTSDWDQLRTALTGAPAYEDPDYRDLGVYMANVAAESTNPTLAADAKAVLTALQAAVTARTDDFRGSQGMAIYLPGPGDAADYASYASTYKAQNAAFEGATNWGLFLDKLETAPAAATAADWAGHNTNAPFAFNLHAVLGNDLVYDDLQIGASQQRWFRFTTEGTGTSTSTITLTNDATAGALTFSLYGDPNRPALQQVVSSSGTATLSLNNRPAGRYFVEVQSGALAHGSAYQLRFDAPPASGPVGSLAAQPGLGPLTSGGPSSGPAQPNDRDFKSRDLGLIDTTTEFAGNVIQPGSPAWFQFETPRESTVAREIVVASPYTGTLTVSLYAYDPATGTETLIPTPTGTGTGMVAIPYDGTTARTYRLEVVSNGSSAPIVVGLRMQAVIAGRLAITTPPRSSVTAGGGFGLAVSVEDASGVVDTSYNGGVTIALANNPGGATLHGTLTVTAVAGVATFSGLTLDRAGTGYTLEASSDGLTSAVTSGFSVTPAAASSFVLSGLPSPATAGTAFGFTVTADDAYGNVATGYTGTVHFTSSDPAAILPANYTFTASDAGTHHFSATLETSNTQTITATDALTASISGNGKVTVTPAPTPTPTPTPSPTPTPTPTPTPPTIIWPTPAPIVYGTALGAAQLDATANVPGIFVYFPAAGAVLGAGTETLSVIFTPTDSADYTTAAASVTLNVVQATPTITWPTPAGITYGTALSPAQLDATASVPGTFAYSPAAGAVLPAGTDTLSVTFTPTDSTDYKPITATTTIVVTRATPTPTPSPSPAPSPTPTSTPTATASPPVLIGEQPMTVGRGKRQRIVGVQIFFSGALDFGTAQGPGNYRVTQRINRKKTRVVPVLSASYHSGDHTVTLLFGRSKGRASMQLTITGLRDSDGTPLSSSTIGL